MSSENERKMICVVVGSKQLDTMPRRYDSDSSVVLERCRRCANRHSRIHTSEPKVVVAFQALHRLGEIELVVQRVHDGKVLEFRHDIKGEMIEPWPDGFFEVEFLFAFF